MFTVSTRSSAAELLRFEHDDLGIWVVGQDVVGDGGAGDAGADDDDVGF